jgi:hypothetical protein
LPKKRLALQMEVRELVKRYGPELGDLYFQSDVSWDKVMKRVRSLENADSSGPHDGNAQGNCEANDSNPDSSIGHQMPARPPSEEELSEQAFHSEFSVIPNESDIVTELSDDLTFAAPTAFLEEKIEGDSISKKND